MAQPDRRQFPRVKIITKVTHLKGDFFHYYYSRDLSIGGMFLETKEPFPEGTRLVLEFPLPDTTGRLCVEGEVVRVVDLEDPENDLVPGMGVRFTRIGDDTHALVANFISQCLDN